MINGIGSALKIILILLQVIVTIVAEVIYVWSQEYQNGSHLLVRDKCSDIDCISSLFQILSVVYYYLSSKIMPQTEVVCILAPVVVRYSISILLDTAEHKLYKLSDNAAL